MMRLISVGNERDRGIWFDACGISTQRLTPRCHPRIGDEEEEEEEAAPANDRKAKAAALKAARDKELEEKKAAALERLAKKEAKQRSLCNLEASPHSHD